VSQSPPEPQRVLFFEVRTPKKPPHFGPDGPLFAFRALVTSSRRCPQRFAVAVFSWPRIPSFWMVCCVTSSFNLFFFLFKGVFVSLLTHPRRHIIWSLGTLFSGYSFSFVRTSWDRFPPRTDRGGIESGRGFGQSFLESQPLFSGSAVFFFFFSRRTLFFLQKTCKQPFFLFFCLGSF